MVVAVLSLGAFLITAHATRRGLEDVFRQRFVQAERVLSEYSRSHDLARMTELQSVLGSPRFLAALETGDPPTVANELPTHALLLEADFVRITNFETGDRLFDSVDESIAKLLPPRDRPIDLVDRRLVAADDAVYEVVTADIWANNGARLGRLEIVQDFGGLVAEDLRLLTGLDVLIALNGRIVDRPSGQELELPGAVAVELLSAEPGEVSRRRVAGEEVWVIRLLDPTTSFEVLFLGSVDAAVSPIMKRITVLLVALAIVGGLVATLAAGVFTRRRVGRVIERLVRDSERIAGGDLDFVIESDSSDELGHLAGELERMRSELLQGRERVEESHHARLNSERMAAVGQMATGIIHDFKTPMAVVQGTTDLIALRDPDNERLAKQCSVIHRQVERMVALARDVIEYSRGDTVLEPAVTDVAEYLERIRELHEEPFRQAGLQLVVTGGPSVQVLIDPDRMQRVIDNLLGNAREVSRVGDRVWLEWEQVADAAGTSVCFRVRDEGPGIPPEIAETLFEPFVTSGKAGGSGLGLAISRKIAEDHGAVLTVSSEENQGTSFVVRLPGKLLVQATEVPVTEGAPS